MNIGSESQLGPISGGSSHTGSTFDISDVGTLLVYALLYSLQLHH